jgi:predicted O-methyltransferase YrrM
MRPSGLKPSGLIPPGSPAAEAFHRALIAVQARRVATRAHPGAAAIGRALAGVARDELPPEEREWIDRIEARRTEVPFEMAAASATFALGPPAEAEGASGNGGPPPEPDAATELAQAWHVARWASIPPVWGRVLTRLVRELAPGRLLELGTGLGLSGAYQGAAMELNDRGRLVTLDVHEAGRIAERGFGELGLAKRIEHVPGYIDETLPEVLGRHGPVDFAFLDAEHTEAATVRHFELVLPHLADGAVAVFDDTNQTEEMRRAWRTVIANPRVTLALPLRRIGIVAISSG